MKLSRKLTLIVFVVIVGGIGTAYAGMNQIHLNATQTNVNGNLQVTGDTILGDSSGMSLQASDAGIDILSDSAGTFTFSSLNTISENDFEVKGDTSLGLDSGGAINLAQTSSGIDLKRGPTSGFTFDSLSTNIQDTSGNTRVTFDDTGVTTFDSAGNEIINIGGEIKFKTDTGSDILTADRTGEFLILGDGPTRNHIFISPTGTIIIDGPTEITGKLTATGGVDPPYVSFSAQTHQGIRALAPDLNPTEEVMIFWNTNSKQMEVYVIAEDKFYAMPLQEIEE